MFTDAQPTNAPDMLVIPLLYPEQRNATEREMETWYADLKTDGKVAGDADNLWDALKEMEDIGVVTVDYANIEIIGME